MEVEPRLLHGIFFPDFVFFNRYLLVVVVIPRGRLENPCLQIFLSVGCIAPLVGSSEDGS